MKKADLAIGLEVEVVHAFLNPRKAAPTAVHAVVVEIRDRHVVVDIDAPAPRAETIRRTVALAAVKRPWSDRLAADAAATAAREAREARTNEVEAAALAAFNERWGSLMGAANEALRPYGAEIRGSFLGTYRPDKETGEYVDLDGHKRGATVEMWVDRGLLVWMLANTSNEELAEAVMDRLRMSGMVAYFRNAWLRGIYNRIGSNEGVSVRGGGAVSAMLELIANGDIPATLKTEAAAA